MTIGRKYRSIALVGTMVCLANSACGSGSLSASSSCQDFMKASASAQQEVVDRLASDYRKPDFATPLGEPEVPYYCSANPSVTLEQFFQKAED